MNAQVNPNYSSGSDFEPSFGPDDQDVAAQPAENYGLKKGKLVADLKELVSDAEELLKLVANSSTDELTAVRAKVEEKLAEAKVKLQGIQSTAREKAKQASDVTNEYVRENPWRALGIAAAAGLITGFLLTRR